MKSEPESTVVHPSRKYDIPARNRAWRWLGDKLESMSRRCMYNSIRLKSYSLLSADVTPRNIPGVGLDIGCAILSELNFSPEDPAIRDSIIRGYCKPKRSIRTIPQLKSLLRGSKESIPWSGVNYNIGNKAVGGDD